MEGEYDELDCAAAAAAGFKPQAYISTNQRPMPGRAQMGESDDGDAGLQAVEIIDFSRLDNTISKNRSVQEKMQYFPNTW